MDKYNLLLVDDEPNIIRSLKRLFRGERVNIFTAPCAEEALERFKEARIHVLVTDNVMPGMNGVELLRQVKSFSPDTIRIILSGYSDMDAILNAVNEGEAYRFILKPWNDTDLKIAVNIALAQYKLAEDNSNLKRELQEKNSIIKRIRSKHPELFSAEREEKTYDMDASDHGETTTVSLADKEA